MLIVFTVVLLMIVGYWFRPREIDYCLTNIDTFYAEEKNSIDVIVHGSSHAWYGIDTGLLENECGIKSYNMGCNGEHVNTTTLMVKDSLKTQTPKVMIIDSFRFAEWVHENRFDYEIYYTRKLSLNLDKIKYIRKWFGGFYGEYIHYFMPMVAYHDKWEEIRLSDFEMDNKDVDLVETRGYFQTIIENPIHINEAAEQKEFADVSLNYLDEIVNACEEKGVKILFVHCLMMMGIAIVRPWSNMPRSMTAIISIFLIT